MWLILVFITLTSGQVIPRTSITLGEKSCTESLPSFIRLYQEGKFEDGPPIDKIRDIRGRCIKVEEDKPPLICPANQICHLY